MMSLYFPVGIFGLALVMLVAHARSWRGAQSSALSSAERVFRHNQFRRRMQASFLLALVAPAMLAGQWLDPARAPRVFVGLWGTIAAATCWVGWLAILDAMASSRHYSRLSRERATHSTRRRQELEQISAEARSSHADAPRPEP